MSIGLLMVTNPPRLLHCLITSFVLLAAALPARAEHEQQDWIKSKQFSEASFTTTVDPKIRIHVNAPLDANGNPERATRLIVFALPNGNTLEQTLGCQMKPGLDWHYDIQHVAAQVRLLRTITPEEKIVLVCAEAPGLSWPSFRATQKNPHAIIRELVDKWRKEFGSDNTKVFLTGHSGGGGFMFSILEAGDAIPDYIDRIAFLDANYNFDGAKHGGKFEQWLKGDNSRRLIVIAYDDRDITFNGKKVVGSTGGTYRATGRMREAFGSMFPLAETTNPPFRETTGLDGRIHFFVHPNPANKILHTALVGEMNGLVHAATVSTPHEEKWGKFGGPRAYTKFVQPAPPDAPKKASGSSPSAATAAPRSDGKPLASRPQSQLPSRPQDALGGREFMQSIAGVKNIADREAAILREITQGNFPNFLRSFKAVPITGTFQKGGKEINATIEVTPDYLAVGADEDFVRIPMTPQTAQKIADQFGCMLPTRKLVDAIDRVAEQQVAPHPMTEQREAVATFLEHNAIIEKQRGDKPLGLLLVGTKKDIVLSPRIFERPQRLAIYGWRQLNGQPIQPLTIVHWNGYVDYSHGVRLIRDEVKVDGQTVKLSELLADPDRCELMSDEGPMKPPRYPER